MVIESSCMRPLGTISDGLIDGIEAYEHVLTVKLSGL